jgi:hypothetical protein
MRAPPILNRPTWAGAQRYRRVLLSAGTAVAASPAAACALITVPLVLTYLNLNATAS